ncbi:ComEA family DNA-binding protein [Lacisediminimonas profundi]|uniref:ComEA family DNA-binding protein n=1 Tax=Lacisediminimonas profundi TaxID=2603856 RepID=UPI00124B50FF|nr:helix-hairpin-helix domain-containing protein [Lacisediminimonas profundi]
MIRKILLALAFWIASAGFAFAQVDVNKADEAALDSVKGIGPAISKRIVEERKKGGNFKDWPDFEKRVKGVGDKSAAKMSESGLTVNGQGRPGAAAPKAEKKADKSKEAKPSGGAGAMKEARPAASAGKDAKAGDAKEPRK